MNNARLIFVAGPVAAGKSTIGRLLAKQLNFKFSYDEWETNPYVKNQLEGKGGVLENQMWFIERNGLRYKHAEELLSQNIKGVVFDKPPFQTHTFIELAQLTDTEKLHCHRLIDDQMKHIRDGYILIKLSGSAKMLAQRSKMRGRTMEKGLEEKWFKNFINVQNEQMRRWPSMPTIDVSIEEFDLTFNQDALTRLVLLIQEKLL